MERTTVAGLALLAACARTTGSPPTIATGGLQVRDPARPIARDHGPDRRP